MRNAFLPMQTNTLDPAIEAAPPCGEHAARALCQRVASLRAALDAVRDSLPVQDPLQAPVQGARLELDRLARDVRALVDWSLPSPVRTLDCSLEELGLAAVDVLQPERRGRTLVAVDAPRTRVFVDGPLISRSLARILEHGFAAGADHADLHIGPCDGGFAAVVAFQGTGAAEVSVSTGLADALARRDLARIGASFGAECVSRRTVVTFAGPAHSSGGAR